MSEKRKDSHAPELDVDALFDDPDDELESGAALANARASAALGGSTPDNSSPVNPLREPSAPRGSAPAESDPFAATPPPARDQLETILDLDAEAQLPAVLSPGAPSSASRPSNWPPPIGRRSVAPPMSVPSLRPPDAMPPPIRQTLPPPERTLAGGASVSGTAPTPRAPRSLPPHAPAPTARRKPESVTAPDTPDPSSRAAYDAPTRELSPELLQSVKADVERAAAVAHGASTETPDARTPDSRTPAGLTSSGTLLGPYGRSSAHPNAPGAHPAHAQPPAQPGNSQSAHSQPVLRATFPSVGPAAVEANVTDTSTNAGTTVPNAGVPSPAVSAVAASNGNVAPASAQLSPEPSALEPGGPLQASPEDVGARRNMKAWLPMVIACLLLLVGGLLWASTPQAPGALIVSASGPESQAIPKLVILVDDESRCSYSPCRVSGLEAGLHVIQARAPGFSPSAAVTIEMAPATDVTHNFVLDPEVRLGGLRVTARGEGLSVFVNDRPHGKPPVEIHDLIPGEYEVRVEGERFEPSSERIVIEPGERRNFGPLTPKVRRGLLTVTLGANAEDARITLDGKRVGPFPTSIELNASEAHTLTARKAEFHDFEQQIEFAPGRALVEVEIAMLEIGEDDGTEDNSRSSTSAATRKATLSINSIPASTILLDGKPIGATPKQRVSVSPGKHSVTFVHPKRGKKTISVKVKPGETRTVSTRF